MARVTADGTNVKGSHPRIIRHFIYQHGNGAEKRSDLLFDKSLPLTTFRLHNTPTTSFVSFVTASLRSSN